MGYTKYVPRGGNTLSYIYIYIYICADVLYVDANLLHLQGHISTALDSAATMI